MKHIKKMLWWMKRRMDTLFGTVVDTWYWKVKNMRCSRDVFEQSITHPHRTLLLDTISQYKPIENALEVGSGNGANLARIAQAYPEAALHGIDVSGRMIRKSHAWLLARGAEHVSLARGSADNLSTFTSKSIDVVFSDAALIYVGVDKIKNALAEMLRVARKAVVLCELHTDMERSLRNDHWIHNYRVLLKALSKQEPKLVKIPPQLWGGDWEHYGFIITISL